MHLLNKIQLKFLLTLFILITAFIGLHFPDSNNSLILSAQASEINWTQLDIPQQFFQMNAIACPDSGTILCAVFGTSDSFQKVIMTTSDGVNWQNVYNSTLNLQFINVECPKNKGILCIATGFNSGTPVIMTTNDIASWTPLTLTGLPENTVFEQISCPDIDGIFCIAVGHAYDGSAVIVTTSDGTIWDSAENLPVGTNDYPAYLGAVVCPDTNDIKCVAFGNLNGQSLFLTTTNGVDWERRLDFPLVHVHKLSCPKSNGILCVAAGVTFDNEGVILTTADGINWTNNSNIPDTYSYNDVVCPGYQDDFCTAVGGISATTSDGITWESSTFPDYTGISDISCPNNGGIYCAAVGNNFMEYKGYIFLASAPSILAPTDKDQCKNDGWENFPGLDFKNQGDCVSYVVAKGKK